MLFKNGTTVATPSYHVISQAAFTLRGALGILEIFAISLLNVGEDQKKFHHLIAGFLAVTVPYYGKSGPSYCITFMKRLDEA